MTGSKSLQTHTRKEVARYLKVQDLAFNEFANAPKRNSVVAPPNTVRTFF